MGAFDEAELQLRTGLANWDFSPAYPVGYTGDKTVAVVPGWPSDVIDNILGGNQIQGQLKRAVISVRLQDSIDSFRTLGGVLGAGAGTTTRYATRIELVYTITCWTTQILGAGDTARKLAGQVEGCLFYNRSRLPALRQLHMRSANETYQDRAQFWTWDVTVEGFALVSYDA